MRGSIGRCSQQSAARSAATEPHHDHAGREACHDHAAHARPAAAHDPAALISARGLALARAGRPILTDIDIDIAPGEIVTVIGPNGAGKTMLVRALLGLEPVDSGEVRRRDGLIVGYAPQRFDVDRAIPLTVARFVALGKPAAQAEIGRVLADVGAGKLIERQLSELSGGELQRVVLARALARCPACSYSTSRRAGSTTQARPSSTP